VKSQSPGDGSRDQVQPLFAWWPEEIGTCFNWVDGRFLVTSHRCCVHCCQHGLVLFSGYYAGLLNRRDQYLDLHMPKAEM
jgi:hypothetical protein